MRSHRLIALSGSVLALGALALTGSPAQANFVFGTSGFPTPQATVDFNQFNGAFTTVNGNGNSLQVGNAQNSVTLTTTAQALAGSAFFGLGANGHWDSAKSGFIGLNGEQGALTFHFDDGPVSSVGAFFNYDPDLQSNPILFEALASDGSVLESLDTRSTPITTPNSVDAGAFRGFVRNTADIAALRVVNAFFAVDDLQFSRPAVSVAAPEPGSLALAALGILPLGVILRRRTAKRSL